MTNSSHAAISSRLLAKRSPRLYARSTAFSMTSLATGLGPSSSRSRHPRAEALAYATAAFS